MNIKSNKEKKGLWNFKLSFKFVDYVPSKLYLIIPAIDIFLNLIVALVGGGWIFVMVYTIIGIIAQIILVMINEISRREEARYFNEDSRYGKDKLSIFSLIGIPVIMIILGYPHGIKPMIYNYKHSKRIDKVLVIDNNISLYYNDSNYAFILFVDNLKEPLMIDEGGASDTYNRLKADFLDNKIKVKKKKVKSWLDDKAVIKYSLDGHDFD